MIKRNETNLVERPTTSADPDKLKFIEIERVEWMFRTFELADGRVGSGRPKGERNEMWGAFSILARSALEEAIRRLHSLKCSSRGCAFDNPVFQPQNFLKFVDDHSDTAFEELDQNLHLQVRKKPSSKAGDGSGVKVNGPRTRKDFEDALDALNWTRNGFDHHGQNKLEKIPSANGKVGEVVGEGIYWVAGKNDQWTVQKPHAFSTVRLCRLVHRLLVAQWWGLETALSSRSAPMHFIADDTGTSARTAAEVLDAMVESLSNSKPNEILAAVRELQESILGPRRASERPAPLFAHEEEPFESPLSDPLISTRPRSSSPETMALQLALTIEPQSPHQTNNLRDDKTG